MTDAQKQEPAQQKPIRLWPGVVILVLQWLARFVLPKFSPEAAMYGMLGGIFIGGLAMIVWWTFFSRLPWSERLGGLGLMIVAVWATPFLLHESIKSGGMGIMFIIFVIPILSLALVGWGVVSRSLSGVPRRAMLIGAILFACGMWTLVRTEGATGEFDQDFAWRWAETPEQRLLAQEGDEPVAPISAPTIEETGVEWPGFLGPNRDGVISGVQIETDWAASPPVEMWRRPIGPGWSSFSVRGDLLYTQEQRVEDEVVACYRVSSGEPVWRHKDASRFWESIGGAGPRGTPSLSGDHVYSVGGNGIVNALDAIDGSVVWSRNAVTDTGAKVPIWGISSSPLVLEDLVLVAASGSLVAYERVTGEPRWFGPAEGVSYSSPHLLTIDGVTQVLFSNGAGLSSVTPSDGKLLWQHPWPGEPVVQPTLTADGDLLIHASAQSGIRRIAVSGGADGWSVEERWTSLRLKPYYSEFVVHKGHVFGFNGSLLACIDVEKGERKWKGGRYGAGQLFLLADQGLLLVLSEKGQLVLVSAASDKLTELTRFTAMKGKTWNHPVLVGDVLLVRNAEEMVAFRLSLVSDSRALPSGASD